MVLTVYFAVTNKKTKVVILYLTKIIIILHYIIIHGNAASLLGTLPVDSVAEKFLDAFS